MLLKSIGVDSFFNGILFILIYNIKLSKKDKIEYYRSFILGTGVRYLYLLTLSVLCAVLSCILFVETDLTFFACPLFIYYFYNKLYYKRVVDIIYSKCRRTITNIVSGVIYNILQFLCKTVLTEECSVRQQDVADFYERVGYKKLSQFGQSFAMACVYDYISVHYPYLGYVLNGSVSSSSQKNVDVLNYEYKQRILGILNSKDWDRLFDSQTIHLFFHIYRTGNNRQIYRYIQYQLTRIQYRMLIFFSTWSVLSVIHSEVVCALAVPLLFMYIYQEDTQRRTYLYAISPFISYWMGVVVSVFLLTIPFHVYGETWRVLSRIPYPIRDIGWVLVSYVAFVLFGTLNIGLLHTRIFVTMMSFIVLRLEDAYVLTFFMGVGMFSNYAIAHGLLLSVLCMVGIGVRMATV